MGCTSPASNLPPNAQPLSSDDPRVAKILGDLQGEWEVFQTNNATLTYQSTTTITNNNYSTQSASSTSDAFVWFVDPNDPQKLYHDKGGSYIQSINSKKGEVTIIHWTMGNILWRRSEKYLHLSKFVKTRSIDLDADPNINLPINDIDMKQTAVKTTAQIKTGNVCTDCGKQKHNGKIYDTKWYCDECWAYYQ